MVKIPLWLRIVLLIVTLYPSYSIFILSVFSRTFLPFFVTSPIICCISSTPSTKANDAPLPLSGRQGGACVRFSLPLPYSEFLSHGYGAAERYAVVLVDRFNAHAVALRNGVEGIAGTYGVVRVFQHTGGFFPFLFQIDDVARRERGAARHFVVTAQTAL